MIDLVRNLQTRMSITELDALMDTNYGGAQSTSYVYEGGGTGTDYIMDFTAGSGANHDVLVIAAGASLTSFAAVQASAYQYGSYTVLGLGGGDTVLLNNVAPGQLTAANFIFS